MNEMKRSWQVLNIPNLLSIARMLLVIPIIYCMLQEGSTFFYIMLILIAIGILTDSLDGILARKFNQITETGKLLDPLADKIVAGALLVVLVLYKDFPLWVAAIIIGRDVLILLAALFWAKKYKFIMPSNRLGKVTACIYAALITFYIIEVPILQKVFIILAIIFAILSGIVYMHRFIVSIKNQS